MSEQNEQQSVEAPAFIVNLIGRLVAENEALRNGLIPAQSVVTYEDTEPADG